MREPNRPEMDQSFPDRECQRPRSPSAEQMAPRVYRGTMVHSLSLGSMQMIEDAAILVDARGRIVEVYDMSQEDINILRGVEVVDLRGKLIMPGFVDGHAHAPQYAFTGTGMDMPLLEWLETYTFPVESKFRDLDFARHVYTSSVNRHLRYGTTTCSYFATIHVDACKVLVDVVKRAGQRAYIGKVSMDRNSPDYLIEATEDAIRDAEDFAKYVLREDLVTGGGKESISEDSVDNLTDLDDTDDTSSLSSDVMSTTPTCQSPKGHGEVGAASQALVAISAGQLKGVECPLITPVITPRFVPSCTAELLQALGDISHQYCLPVQSHLSESPGEIAWVRELHPECESYAAVYDRYGLLHERSYFAHCVHCSGPERAMMAEKGGGVVHCPSSNFMLSSGVCNLRRYIREGVKVGLGTDVAGGYSASMLDCMRQAIVASRVCSFGHGLEQGEEPTEPLTFQEVFHVATQGGAEVLGLGEAVGNFLPGKQFDALVICPKSGPYDLFPALEQGSQDAFEKFLFLGDDRNIQRVYVGGVRVV